MSGLALLPAPAHLLPTSHTVDVFSNRGTVTEAGNDMGLILLFLPLLYVNFTGSSMTALLLSGFQYGIPHSILLEYFLGLLRSVTTFFFFKCGPF